MEGVTTDTTTANNSSDKMPLPSATTSLPPANLCVPINFYVGLGVVGEVYAKKPVQNG